MKNRSDGTHEPGLRRAGAPDAAPEVDQAELDALAARVAVLENTVNNVHAIQLAGYSAEIALLSAMMEQRKDTLVRVGIAADVALVDTGPRYMLQAWEMTAQGPTTADVLQIKNGDQTRAVMRFRDVITNSPPLEEFSPDRVPGYWNPDVVADGQLQQLNSDDFTEVGMNFLGFFERPGALKRQYLLKAVTGGNGGDGTPVPLSAVGARVGDTVYTVAGNDMGSIARLFNDAGLPVDNPFREVPLHPDTDLFETTVTVDDEIQQISADDLTASTFLFLLCRGATEEAAEPRDYFLTMATGNNGAGAVSCPRSFLGDVVESVIKIQGGPAYIHELAHADDQFEATISTTDQIQQTGSDDLSIASLLIFFSRPASAPTPGTPAPIALPGAVESDAVVGAFLVDQESGELAELYPVSDYFEATVTVNNQIQQIAGQLDGKAIAFVLKHIYPMP